MPRPAVKGLIWRSHKYALKAQRPPGGQDMARSLDDDASWRLRAAEREVETREQQTLAEARRLVRRWEGMAARHRRLRRVRLNAALLAAVPVLAGAGWTLLVWGSVDRYARVDIACGIAVLPLLVTAVVAAARLRPLPSAQAIEESLEKDRDALRFLGAFSYPSLAQRRSLYREDVADIVEQYQADSLKYRRTHNYLQVLIMVGSAATTTIAALDSGREPTWQSLTLTALGFAITLAAAFTGYYKYRERSYFLQQTADAIEEESNAVALGIGPYAEFGTDQEEQALARFTQRVEDLRNEQRRRQQQLDQPAEQAGPAGQPQA